jgi:Xaa-Pro aminopeptidase
MDYNRRLNLVRQENSRQNIDLFVCTNMTNIRYLTGFSGSSGMVLVSDNEAYLITDSRYGVRASNEVTESYRVKVVQSRWNVVKRLMQRKKYVTLGIEANTITLAQYQRICALLPDTSIVPVETHVERIRSIKEGEEIALLKEASRILDTCFEDIPTLLHEGITELGLAHALEEVMRLHGGDGLAFPTIVASGAQSALPHATPSDKQLCKGDLLTIDMGVLYKGYCSDATRTYCIGRATPLQQQLYTLVWQAQTRAAAQMVPGKRCKSIDEVARAVLRESGYEGFFTHALGHGLGLDVHEMPVLSKRDKSTLQTGMVVTCEPGIYIEGWGGIRIEDTYYISDGGSISLNAAAKPEDLPILQFKKN